MRPTLRLIRHDSCSRFARFSSVDTSESSQTSTLTSGQIKGSNISFEQQEQKLGSRLAYVTLVSNPLVLPIIEEKLSHLLIALTH